MIFQFASSAAMGLLVLYAFSQWRNAPVVSALVLTAALAGIYLIWLPEHTGAVASWVGIGRGADLMLYVWIILSLFLFLNLHLKLRGNRRLIAELTRDIALERARRELAQHEG